MCSRRVRPRGHDSEPQEGLTLEEIEERAICEALRRNHGRKMAAAKELGINKTTLWRKMKRLGIKPTKT